MLSWTDFSKKTRFYAAVYMEQLEGADASNKGAGRNNVA